MQISFAHMKGTVQKLRKRVESRIKLTKQINQFAKNVIRCDKDITAMLPIQVSLHQWFSKWGPRFLRGSQTHLGARRPFLVPNHLKHFGTNLNKMNKK